MAGIYIHIPFCHKACVYCDFHFTTSLRYKDRMLQAIEMEIAQRASETSDPIETIYFGGGTPSAIFAQEIESIIRTVYQHYKVQKNPEVTLEANPEDISVESVKSWAKAGINRLSIGIQSFRNTDLKWMNRGHSAEEAKTSVITSAQNGIENISADLIFGLPNMSLAEWENNVRELLALPVKHISLYSLTVEEKTALAHQVKTDRVQVPGDEAAAEQFLLARNLLEQAGFEHYEISNYAKPGWISQHNSSYWKDVKYLGFGPSAHSFDGNSRRWNLSNNQRYMKGLEANDMYWEVEHLSEADRYNEYILTKLRTVWGCDVDFVQSTFGVDLCTHSEVRKQISNGTVVVKDGMLVLTKEGFLMADRISSDLFLEI